MTLPRFVLGMAFVILVVGVWSWTDSASMGTIILRLVACAVILQVGYFVGVLIMVARNGRDPSKVDSAPKPSRHLPSAEKVQSRHTAPPA